MNKLQWELEGMYLIAKTKENIYKITDYFLNESAAGQLTLYIGNDAEQLYHTKLNYSILRDALQAAQNYEDSKKDGK